MNNNYFVLRHGESEANVLGIILSDPKEGVGKFGLSSKGVLQVKESATNSIKKGMLDKNTVIVSSDFKRAKETAEVAKEILGVKDIIFDKRLRERYFGDHEKTNNSNYQRVWEYDKTNADNKNNNVESPNEVTNRVKELILELENKFNNKKILLVSHGDALQILQTHFLKESPCKHREVQHLETAEIRQLISK